MGLSHAILLLAILPFSACISAYDGSAQPSSRIGAPQTLPRTLTELVSSLDSGGPAPFSLHMEFRDCWLGGVIWLVELSHAQSLLPKGFQASTLEEVLSKDQADAVLDLLASAGVHSVSGRGVILSFQHICASSTVDAGPSHLSFLWVPVEPPEAGKGVPGKAISESFSLGTGSSGLFRQLQVAMGESLVGDEVLVDAWSEIATGPTQRTRLLEGGQQVFSVRTGPGIETSPSRNVRVYSTPVEGGLAVLDAATGPEGDRNFLTLDVECEVAAGSILARAVGGTSCRNASRAIPVGVTQPPHHHVPVSIYYQPNWSGGPIHIEGPVIHTKP